MTEFAEQVPIALALLEDGRTTIYSDSTSAVLAFGRGTILKSALQILRNKEVQQHTIVWFPARTGQIEGALSNLNDKVHRAARGVVDRVATERRDDKVLDNQDPPTTNNELCKNFYLRRRKYLPPRSKLNRPQALTLRLLQVGAYHNSTLLYKIYPAIQMSNTRTLYSDFASLDHMPWWCPALRVENVTLSKWDATLRSTDLKMQLWALQRAYDVADVQVRLIRPDVEAARYVLVHTPTNLNKVFPYQYKCCNYKDFEN